MIDKLRHTLTLLMAALGAMTFVAYAQLPLPEPPKPAQQKAKLARQPSAWTLDIPTGLHIPSTIDTLFLNYQRHDIPTLVSDAYATTGNLGAEGLNLLWFERPQMSHFFFDDAIRPWMPWAARQKFYDVFVPMTLASYDFGGSRDTGQERLAATFAGNVNRRIGIGAFIDYLYSKGSYNNQAVKDLSYGFSGYYLGDRYQMQAFFYNYNMLNKENGGITDPLYITDPAELQGGVSSIQPKSIPTNLSAAHNRVRGTEFYMNHAYNVGFWRDEQVNDTLTRQVYVPVTKFSYSFDYSKGRHTFRNTNADQAAKFWEHAYLDAASTNDRTSYWQISNTVAISMLEGFSKWAKFGLSAYATLENRKYTQANKDLTRPEDLSALTPMPAEIAPTASQNHLWAGGRLSRLQGTILKYDANAKFGLTGDIAGDIDLNGNITTTFRMLGDTVMLAADAAFRNTAQPYLIQHYVSNHFVWDNDFGKTRSVRIGGKLHIPWTNTTLSAAVDNIQNYVFFYKDGMPRQCSGSIRVFAASLEQRLRLGILHWDNRVTFQTSSRQEYLPLPALTIYSNLYMNLRAFRVLDLQIGVDADWYSRYRGYDYQPATMSFTVGDDYHIGNFPFCNAYVTAKLYKVRFFILYSHFNSGWFTKEYFSLPNYPVNPARLLMGLSVDFAN